MLRSRNLVGILAAVCAVGLQAGTASANLDLNETGAALALPVITSATEGLAVTYTTITNASSEGITLHVNVIDGDEGSYKGPLHNWGSTDFDCYVTAHETTLFVFQPDGPGRSKVDYECSATGSDQNSDPTQLNIKQTEYFNHATGIMFVAVEQGGVTVSKNVIFGDWVTVDYALGKAYSAEAISFQGVDPLSQDGDTKYKFDNKEYSAFPAFLATNFIAPNPGLKAELILFTLDGTVGQEPVPVGINFAYYNDDEKRRSGNYAFDCFVVVNLLTLSPNFEDYKLGSAAGHLEMTPTNVTNANAAHDNSFGDNNGVRNTPFHGWIVETIMPGGAVGSGLTPATPPGATSSGYADWARTLAQSTSSHQGAGGDVDTLNAH